MVTLELKNKIVEAIKSRRDNYASAAKMAVALGTSSAQLSRILNGETEGVLSESAWISIARKLNVQLGGEMEWKTAETPVFVMIYTQLERCQAQHSSGMLCDASDIGKTYTARVYARRNKNVAYVDCSQVKTKSQLVKAIAQEFGVGTGGRYADVYADLVYYLRSLPNPLVILDEAGDLEYKAFLEIKALWNATEGFCGWYMMGADGLKAKIEMNRNYRRVGYEEIFTRFGSGYQKITPDGREASDDFTRQQVALIARANHTDVDVQQMYAKTRGSLRRIALEIHKLIAN